MKQLKIIIVFILVFSFTKGLSQDIEKPIDSVQYTIGDSWDSKSWTLSKQSGSSVEQNSYNGQNNDGIKIIYNFPSSGGWFDMNIAMPDTYKNENPIVFYIQTSSPGINRLELKFQDADGSVFGVRTMLKTYSHTWKLAVLYLNNTEYWWGGNNQFGTFSRFSIAASGETKDTIWIDQIGLGKLGLQSTFQSPYYLDPDSTLPGFGVAQRRDSVMNPEDDLVLEYLKQVQDYASTNKKLVSSQGLDAQGQTFNNSLAAMAFIVKNEKERAERILDYYTNGLDINNKVKNMQSFYFNGSPRGFYQNLSLSTGKASGDRWIGDMAWLFFSCKTYEIHYNSHRYDSLIYAIRDLFDLLYRDYPSYGYVATGWRNNDASFDTLGHHEGNIDCYAVFKLLGDNYRAQKIKKWLQLNLTDTNYPLDLYTWRAMSFGKNYAYLLNYPEYNFNYRKTLSINNQDVIGLYCFSNFAIQNIWTEGNAHISCAYQSFGDKQKGYFYANQLDKQIITTIINGVTTHSLPYAAKAANDFSWVDTTKGFSSTASWYIFAKNGFNPFHSENFEDTIFADTVRYPQKYYPLLTNIDDRKIPEILYSSYPNPFTKMTNASFYLPTNNLVEISVYDLRGIKIQTLVNGKLFQGNYTFSWNGKTYNGSMSANGIYFIKIKTGMDCKTIKIIKQ